MKIGILVDCWKVAVFRRHLDSAGLEFDQQSPEDPDMALLVVLCDGAEDVEPYIAAAESECRRSKLH